MLQLKQSKELSILFEKIIYEILLFGERNIADYSLESVQFQFVIGSITTLSAYRRVIHLFCNNTATLRRFFKMMFCLIASNIISIGRTQCKEHDSILEKEFNCLSSFVCGTAITDLQPCAFFSSYIFQLVPTPFDICFIPEINILCYVNHAFSNFTHSWDVSYADSSNQRMF